MVSENAAHTKTKLLTGIFSILTNVNAGWQISGGKTRRRTKKNWADDTKE